MGKIYLRRVKDGDNDCSNCYFLVNDVCENYSERCKFNKIYIQITEAEYNRNKQNELIGDPVRFSFK